jgi:hypothetical protein
MLPVLRVLKVMSAHQVFGGATKEVIKNHLKPLRMKPWRFDTDPRWRGPDLAHGWARRPELRRRW